MPTLVNGQSLVDLNREGWLTELAKRLEQPVFGKYGLGKGEQKYRLTCGWPVSGGMAEKVRILGECHSLKSSKSGTHEIFISPTLEKPLEVAGVVCHELAHVVAGVDAAHGKGFVQVCRFVGLTKGKPRSVAPGDALNERLGKIIEGLGQYPHAALIGVRKPKKPSMVRSLECTECGCVVTLSLKWLEAAGAPTCGCGGEMEVRG